MDNPQLESEAARFLERDFNESFNEKRRYEDAAWDVCKFAFSVHSTLIGASLAAYQVSLEKKIDLLPAARALLAIGLLIGLFFLFLLVRNRVYFVVVTRYINEHRKFFLSLKPAGFENRSGFFADETEPPYFSWRSTQTWATYVVAVLNAAVASALTFVLFTRQPTFVFVLVFAVILIAQVELVRRYLRSRERTKGASAAVFGRTGS